MAFENLPSSSELPSYSPSAPVPSYSCELACGEQSLQHTPRSRSSRPPPTSLYIKQAGRTTIVLDEQEQGATIPTYGRQAVISGSIVVEQCESILEVVVQVEAKLDTTISEAGGHSTKLLNERYTLWSHSEPQSPPCPSQIPFSIDLPSTFKHNGNAIPLPPSYHTHFIDIPTLFVRAGYQLHFVITRIRHKKVELWPKTKHILVPFKYAPRTRSNRPIVQSPSFFSSVKTSPEEWYQAVTCLKTRPSAKIDPVNCHLFVPAGRVYGLKDTIPFHVQLAGNICALRELFSVPLLDRVRSADSYNTVNSKKSSKATTTKPLIRVYILRQVSVSLKGSKGWRNIVLGEGTIWPIPPELTNCCSSTSECREGHVDWEGDVRCNDDMTVGSFNTANVQVKDFIALSLSPPNHTSPLFELQINVPIRLVTDSWTDTTGMDTALQ